MTSVTAYMAVPSSLYREVWPPVLTALTKSLFSGQLTLTMQPS